MSLDPHQAMWPQMIATLAAIDAELGLPDDGCNSPAQTLEKIRNLRAAEAKCNSYIVDNARLAEENERLRVALALAVRQAEHDMLMTGEEIRKCFAALGPNV